jgi:hypothetical protein
MFFFSFSSLYINTQKILVSLIQTTFEHLHWHLLTFLSLIMAFKIGNVDNSYNMNIRGDAKDVNVHIADSMKKLNDTPTRMVMDAAGRTASKVIQSGGDILTAPAVWLKDMQQNWLSYMAIVAVIVGSVAILYCAFLIHCNRKKNNQAQNHIIELSKIMSGTIATSAPSLPFSKSTLPSLAQNSQV